MKPENKLKELEQKLHIYQQELDNLRAQITGSYVGPDSVAKQAGEAWIRDNKLDRLMAEGYHLRQSMVGGKKWVIEDSRDIMGGYTIRGHNKDALIDEAYQHLIVDTQEPAEDDTVPREWYTELLRKHEELDQAFGRLSTKVSTVLRMTDKMQHNDINEFFGNATRPTQAGMIRSIGLLMAVELQS